MSLSVRFVFVVTAAVLSDISFTFFSSLYVFCDLFQSDQQLSLLRETLLPLQLERDKARFLARRMAPHLAAELMNSSADDEDYDIQ